MKPAVEGTTLIYGPYTNIDTFTSDEFTIRYENPKPLVKAAKLEREVWVSHWGASASFEERYQLHNIGTKLKGNGFSRLDYVRQAAKYTLNIASFKKADIKLASYVREPYFTDLVGNVSTSNFRQDGAGSLLEIRPRFPVFGGWNYNFTIGWSADLKHFIKSIGEDRYMLKVPLIEGPGEISYDLVELTIVLPEGATYVDLILQFFFKAKTNWYLGTLMFPGLRLLIQWSILLSRAILISLADQPSNSPTTTLLKITAKLRSL